MNDMRYIDPTQWVQQFAVEVELISDDDYLKITETLTRMGIANYKERVLTQSCHLVYRDKKYYITHFKELLALDGNLVNIVPDDVLRRNRIVALLVKWKLIKVVDPIRIERQATPTSFTVLSHHEKKKWTLKAKYQVGQLTKK